MIIRSFGKAVVTYFVDSSVTILQCKKNPINCKSGLVATNENNTVSSSWVLAIISHSIGCEGRTEAGSHMNPCESLFRIGKKRINTSSNPKFQAFHWNSELEVPGYIRISEKEVRMATLQLVKSKDLLAQVWIAGSSFSGCDMVLMRDSLFKES